MSPPSFNDLGKSARDVFGKGYHFGNLKLDLKSTTASGVKFNSCATSNTESGKLVGSLETKYKFKEYGFTFTEKWNTDNTLATTLEVQDQLVNGLKLTFDSTFAPQTGAKSGKIKTEYKHDFTTLNADIDLNMNSGPLVNASSVLGHNGWLAGYQLSFDTAKSKLVKNNFGIGYSQGDFVLHTNVVDGQIYGGSVYQRINSQLETGINVGWTASNNATNFGIGCKYMLDKDANIRAKINNSSQLGLGYQQRLRDGVTLTLSTLIDGKNFNQGGHKLGLALEIET